MSSQQVDDFIIFATIGIVAGGRLGYCLFYKPEIFLNPLSVLKVWEGGMSFHGGAAGVALAVWYIVRRDGLSWLRVLDHVAVVYPVGHLFGRMANFVNGELWGKPSALPWAMTFPGAKDLVPRHPSQLYQAALEGIFLAVIMWWLFYRTRARLSPGCLTGVFAVSMGLFRFGLEFFREPDFHVTGLAGLSMGQTLSIPMIIGGAVLIASARRRPAIGLV
jgi:phosphatidylglycerol:prolipoprotein diacylglycerol transferase